MIKKDDINKIKEACSRVKPINYAFLFGSVTKRMRPDSDIDILLDGKITSSQRINLAMELEFILKRKIDIVLAQEASCELVLTAFSRGIPLLIRNKRNLKQDYLKNFYLYDDGQNLREIRTARIKNRYVRGQ